MTLIARNSGGYNLSARSQVTRGWYPTERVRPVRVQVYWRYLGEVAAAARYLGTYAPGQALVFPVKPSPSSDGIIFSVITVSPNGINSVRELADAHEVLLATAVAGGLETLPFAVRLQEASTHHAGRPCEATGVRFPAPVNIG